tara:strand:- start:775 stop:1047 length:273 start_codon:yes stop_codon:yes gene_type:complete
MAAKNVYAICDVCGFRYKKSQMKKNSYGLLVCSTDFDGSYDLLNHPQNKSPRFTEEQIVKDARPPLNDERNIDWVGGETWEDSSKNWNQI